MVSQRCASNSKIMVVTGLLGSAFTVREHCGIDSISVRLVARKNRIVPQEVVAQGRDCFESIRCYILPVKPSQSKNTIMACVNTLQYVL
jgi:hypothetical protein